MRPTKFLVAGFWFLVREATTRSQKPETRNPIIALLLALMLAASTVTSVFADQLDDEVREIARELLCPVCQNLSVADSTSELAQQMRGIIRKKLEAGESREAIVRYFVERYGESVLVAPPKSGFTLGVWLGPIVGLAVGVLALLAVYRSRRAPAPASVVETDDDEGLEAVLAEDLRRYREGSSR